MLKLTKEADYGILILTCFAKKPKDTVLSTKQLSEETGISYRMVCKILNLLTKTNLLLSHRGIHGGYQLGKPSDAISLEEAINALEGGVALTECTRNECDCQAYDHCVVQSHWCTINNAFKSVLSKITISNMTGSTDQNCFQFDQKEGMPIV